MLVEACLVESKTASRTRDLEVVVKHKEGMVVGKVFEMKEANDKEFE